MIFDVKPIEAIQIMVYSKPKNFLAKIYLHYEIFTNFASSVEPNALGDEQALNIALG